MHLLLLIFLLCCRVLSWDLYLWGQAHHCLICVPLTLILSIVIVGFGGLRGLFEFFFTFLYRHCLSMFHFLLRRHYNGFIRRTCIICSLEICSFCRVKTRCFNFSGAWIFISFINMLCVDSPKRRLTFKKDTCLKHAVNILIMNERGHALSYIGHLEDLGGWGTLSRALLH